MIPLGARGVALTQITAPVVGRVVRSEVPVERRGDYVRILLESNYSEDLEGYAGVIVAPGTSRSPAMFSKAAIQLPDVSHLQSNDIVVMQPTGYVRTVFRAQSKHNALFVTERCNSLCLMCSQPPLNTSDEGRLDQLLSIVRLIPEDLEQLGVTGGEPTLLKGDFVRLVAACRAQLPQTSLHVLSNGRLFYYDRFAGQVGSVGHPNLTFGVPLYADNPAEHDYIVQAQGAFDQTVMGIHNLAKYGVSVEIRVVLHKLTTARLPSLAAYIYRNFPFTSHVAFMGLEMIGLARLHRRELWQDPLDYQEELLGAVKYLSARKLRVSIYNHQLCTLPEETWPFARKSISDWKEEYLPVCDGCAVRQECGGLFASVIRHGALSRGIQPVPVQKGQGSYDPPQSPSPASRALLS